MSISLILMTGWVAMVAAAVFAMVLDTAAELDENAA
jgi:hypothetical protein